MNRILKPIFLSILFSIIINAQQVNHPEWSRNATIYEVNVRQFTPEGTFASFSKHLPELKKLGIDILWLMPINPIGKLNRKGTLGSYYSVADYKGVNSEFGSLSDFKMLVKQIHKLGMKVIIDWVANHTAWDNVWVKNHSEFYTKDEKGNFVPPVADWTDVIDLNYDNKQLREFMIDAMKFWVKEYDIDGFRCDVAAMVPIDFWKEAVPELNKIKHVFMLAEASENFIHQAFDMTYNWQLKDLMGEIAKGTKQAEELKNFFEREKKEYNVDDYRMNFTSNHDENSWNGTEFERLGKGAEAFSVLCGTIPGMPLIYSGQEIAMNKRLRFFDKDTIEWKKHPMRNIYTKLNQLKKKNQVLRNGSFGGELITTETNNKNVFAFTRTKGNNKIFALFNFSDSQQKIKIDNHNISGNYADVFNGKRKTFSTHLELELQPWQYFLYSK